MAEEETETTEAKPEVNNEARFKAERDRAKAKLEDTNARLAELEAELREKTAAEEKIEAERRKKAGDFESLEQQWTAKIATAEEQNAAFQAQLEAYQKRDTDRIEAILKDREDADEIRATFDGLPIDRQLALAEKFLAASGTPQKPAPTGKPGSIAGDAVNADIKAEAESIYPGDEAKQKIYINVRTQQSKDKDKPSPFDGGWPLNTPGGAQ
jgi:septal ring factor EnvC (AmiA/AmiB activator)